MTELHGLGNNTGLVGDAAKSAMIAINKSIADRRDIRIITAKGSDVTKNGFFREKLEHDPTDEDDARNIDDVIIKITKQQSMDRAAKAISNGKAVHNTNAEHAILLTEDTNMRVKANARGVPAISTTVLKRYLVKLGPGGTGPAAAALVTSPTSPSKRKSPSPQTRTGQAAEDEDTPMTMFDDDALDKRPPRMRSYKRGKTTLEVGR